MSAQEGKLGVLYFPQYVATRSTKHFYLPNRQTDFHLVSLSARRRILRCQVGRANYRRSDHDDFDHLRALLLDAKRWCATRPEQRSVFREVRWLLVVIYCTNTSTPALPTRHDLMQEQVHNRPPTGSAFSKSFAYYLVT